jgi:hypothetical protein
MKSIKLSAILLSSILLISIFSCNVEPVDADLFGNVLNTASVSGTYRMTAFNTGIPTDLNHDGATSTNQMLETTCFNGSSITLNPDGTFRASSKGIEINSSSTLQCFSNPDYTGTWTYISAGNVVEKLFSVSANRLIYSATQGQIVGTSTTNVPILLNSSYNIIYTR